MMQYELTQEQAQLLREKKLYLFDMDGTLYLGNQLYDFTRELLQTMKKTGRRYLFMTNNSSKSVADYILKLQKLGISSTEADFLTSSQATAWYLKKHHPGKVLYVCGTQSLKDELQRAGFEVTGDPEKTQCIVMGFDTELTFQKLHDVCWLLLTRDRIDYVATNPDYVCPTEFGAVPDCGSVCDMIFNATGKRPVVIGKPSPLMPELAMERTGYSREETAVVGDRIYTDVKSGLNAGITGILVMSGETDEKILEKSPDRPDMVLQDAGQILQAVTNQ